MDIDSAIANLRVKSGDPITRKLWNGLLDLCAALVKSFSELGSSAGVRLHRYPQGINIVADRGTASFTGAFSVRISADEATVSLGTVDHIVPAIGAVRIDDKTPPKLKITGPPNDDLRSWVAIQATVDPESDQPSLDPEDTAVLQVIHSNDLESSRAANPASGFLPLAMLIWSDTKTISRVRQIVYFDQRITITKDAAALDMQFSAAS